MIPHQQRARGWHGQGGPSQAGRGKRSAPRPCARPFLEQLEGRLVPSAFDNQAFVTTLYAGTLGHDPDPGALSFWGAQLAGGASREQVASALIASQQYSGRQVETLYQALLGRQADV